MSVNSTYPRLLYVGDVPVEASYHGSALLYRLLQDYPPERLRIVESNLIRSHPERRLCGVKYEELYLGHPRPLYSRFARGYRAWLTWVAYMKTRRVRDLLGDFNPDAVLTVSHGSAWRAAARFSSIYQIPLHLICHDDLPRWKSVPSCLEGWLDREFGRVYRQSSSRLCVSSFMRDAYRERYGVEGKVLYPSRACDCPMFEQPPRRVLETHNALTGAYGGSIGTEGFARVLRLLAKELASLGGRLLLFGPVDPRGIRTLGLDLPNVVVRGLVSSRELIERCRAEADFLFVPMSFDVSDRFNSELSFPSKLTDYTAAGLPLLICGPSYCSAVRWVKENPAVAECVETEDPVAMRKVLKRLCEIDHRWDLATHALVTGRQSFSYSGIQKDFYSALKVEAYST